MFRWNFCFQLRQIWIGTYARICINCVGTKSILKFDAKMHHQIPERDSFRLVPSTISMLPFYARVLLEHHDPWEHFSIHPICPQSTNINFMNKNRPNQVTGIILRFRHTHTHISKWHFTMKMNSNWNCIGQISHYAFINFVSFSKCFGSSVKLIPLLFMTLLQYGFFSSSSSSGS